MSTAEGIGRTVIWAAIVIIVIIILAVVVVKLLGYLVVAPYAFGSTTHELDSEDANDEDNNIVPQTQKEVDKATVDIGNNTEVTITCTSNIPNLVSCD